MIPNLQITITFPPNHRNEAQYLPSAPTPSLHTARPAKASTLPNVPTGSRSLHWNYAPARPGCFPGDFPVAQCARRPRWGRPRPSLRRRALSARGICVPGAIGLGRPVRIEGAKSRRWGPRAQMRRARVAIPRRDTAAPRTTVVAARPILSVIAQGREARLRLGRGARSRADACRRGLHPVLRTREARTAVGENCRGEEFVVWF